MGCFSSKLNSLVKKIENKENQVVCSNELTVGIINRTSRMVECMVISPVKNLDCYPVHRDGDAMLLKIVLKFMKGHDGVYTFSEVEGTHEVENGILCTTTSPIENQRYLRKRMKAIKEVFEGVTLVLPSPP